MLDKLKNTTSCHGCGCKEITESRQFNKHSNGHWNESVQFRCGYKAQFSPNFMRIIDESECEQSPEHKHMLEKRKAFKLKLAQFIEGGKVDDDFKTRLKRSYDLST